MRFLPEAQREYLEALRWYRSKRDGLAEEFASEFDLRLQRALDAPGAGRLELTAPERFELRWYALRRFPYSFLIGNVRQERLVVAVAHERRKPGYWTARLAKITR